MLPDPLHPAVVHFPVALAILAPLLALLVSVAIRARVVRARSWMVVVLAHAVLAGSAWFATETGEDQEDRVEKVVAERHIHTHEEAAERFLWLAVAAAVVSAGGVLGGSLGGIARVATLAAGVAVIAASYPVGESGGALVYEHGAASAYVAKPSPPLEAASPIPD
jgi:uncharacterized membrane protein